MHQLWGTRFMSSFTPRTRKVSKSYQNLLFFISSEVKLSSVLEQWVKSTPNIPTGDGWKNDFQSMLSQPLAPPMIV